jgi:hypothetical protein
MLDKLLAWYVKTKLGGRFISVVFEQSIASSGTGTFSITDAEDGTKLDNYLISDNFILWEVFAYADPGMVKINVLPDNNTTEKFRLEATKKGDRVLMVPPIYVEADLVIDYENENQPNDIYISFSGMRIPQKNMPAFTLLSQVLPTTLQNIDQQTLNNITQNNTIIQQLNELIKLNKGTFTGGTLGVAVREEKKCGRR